LEALFQEIITNPAEWDPSGLLKLRKKIDPAGPQHSCKIGCDPNMCKGTFDYSTYT
jgi:pyridoxal phosphate phosphatase PHOSPHO2